MMGNRLIPSIKLIDLIHDHILFIQYMILILPVFQFNDFQRYFNYLRLIHHSGYALANLLLNLDKSSDILTLIMPTLPAFFATSPRIIIEFTPRSFNLHSKSTRSF